MFDDVLSNGAEYLAPRLQKMGSTSLSDVGRFMSGGNTATTLQWDLIEKLGGAKGVLKPGLHGQVARMAASKPVHAMLRAVPALAAGTAALDAADIVTNDTSLLNKGMDATAMAVGGVLGSVAGPLGAMGVASLGKMTSDGLQWLFGDKKTPKQRELENALAQLNAGRIG